MRQPSAGRARMDGVMAQRPSNSRADPLPDDPAALRVLVETLMRQRDEDAAARAELVRRMDALEARAQDLELAKLRLEMELLKYKKWMYGPRADKLASLGDVAQMLLLFGEELEQRPIDPVDAADVAAEDTAS
jgi:hypothetical protein